MMSEFRYCSDDCSLGAMPEFAAAFRQMYRNPIQASIRRRVRASHSDWLWYVPRYSRAVVMGSEIERAESGTPPTTFPHTEPIRAYSMSTSRILSGMAGVRMRVER